MTALQVRTGHGVVVKRMENGQVNVSFLSKKWVVKLWNGTFMLGPYLIRPSLLFNSILRLSIIRF